MKFIFNHLSRFCLYLCAAAISLSVSTLVAQEPTKDSTTNIPSTNRPKVFINCSGWWCYEDYVKTELSVFDFVRDRFQADIQLLIIRQESSNGGLQYTLTLIGQNAFANMNDTLKFTTQPGSTDDMVRSELVKTLKRGLTPYILKTEFRNQVTVEFQKRDQAALTKQSDPWDYWVFSIALNGYFEGESNRQSAWLNTNMNIRRITDDSKIIIAPYFSRNRTHFELDTSVTVVTESYGMQGLYAKSLGEHWSLGVVYFGEHSVFRNINLSHRIAPALEYNIYPFSENTRRQVRFVYEFGFNQFNYIEITQLDKMSEGRMFQRLSAVVDVNQPWGSINATVQGLTFMDKMEQNRLDIRAYLNLRIVEGLSIEIQGGASIVNNQIYLPKSEADQSTVLLGGRQLPTSFFYNTYIGINYTFGSIFNSVVNPRLGQLDRNN